MARYTKSDAFSVPALNSELEKIEIAMKDLFSRVGDGPNQLEDTFDVNSQRIINLPEPVSDHEPLTFGRGKGILDQATAQADRAEQEADRAEAEANNAELAADTAAADAVLAAEEELSGYQTATEQAADRAEDAEGQAKLYRDQASNSATAASGSAQQADSSAQQLNTFIDEYVSTGLSFPLDLGFVGDEITNSFDLGELP
jgi:chromosome segregation ATPase